MTATYQVNTADGPLVPLKTVATDLADIIKGYDAMVERADEDIVPLVERLRVLHKTHAAEVIALINEHGGEVKNTGSVMGLVHEAVVTTRDWFDGLDASVVSTIVDGEKRLLESYDDAIGELSNAPDCRNVLADQRKALQSHVDAIED